MLPHSHWQTKFRNHTQKNIKTLVSLYFHVSELNLSCLFVIYGRNPTRKSKSWAIVKILWFYIKCVWQWIKELRPSTDRRYKTVISANILNCRIFKWLQEKKKLYMFHTADVRNKWTPMANNICIQHARIWETRDLVGKYVYCTHTHTHEPNGCSVSALGRRV